ncbi:hypothetical protein BDZ91DRAFT_725212 [Kalaharituber pfeilii]|nr:hypothetical protein BDZ91DRAFT_725212 [Kalaharituber pfeilii]
MPRTPPADSDTHRRQRRATIHYPDKLLLGAQRPLPAPEPASSKGPIALKQHTRWAGEEAGGKVGGNESSTSYLPYHLMLSSRAPDTGPISVDTGSTSVWTPRFGRDHDDTLLERHGTLPPVRNICWSDSHALDEGTELHDIFRPLVSCPSPSLPLPRRPSPSPPPGSLGWEYSPPLQLLPRRLSPSSPPESLAVGYYSPPVSYEASPPPQPPPLLPLQYRHYFGPSETFLDSPVLPVSVTTAQTSEKGAEYEDLPETWRLVASGRIRRKERYFITFDTTWSMPSVYAQCPDLSNILVIVHNSVNSFEAVPVSKHMANRWGNVGLHMLELLQEGCSSFHPQSSQNPTSLIKSYSIDANGDLFCVLRKNSILNGRDLTFNIYADTEEILESACNSIAWAIGALRPQSDKTQLSQVNHVRMRILVDHPIGSPQKLSAISIAASPEEWYKRTYRNWICPGNSPLLSFDEGEDFELRGYRDLSLQDKQDSPCTCWKKLFGAIVVMESKPDVFKECRYPFGSSNISDSLPGLLVDYEVLLHLSAVTHEVLCADGIVLIGFETALIPLTPLENQPSDVIRWHFITTPGEQVTYDLLDVPNQLMVQDSSMFHNTKALVGWTTHARMLVGSSLIDVHISGARRAQQPKLHVKSMKSIRPQVACNVSIMPVISFTLNPRRERVHTSLPCEVAFNAASNLCGILNQASKMHFILCDTESGHAWLVPALNYLIFAVSCYLKENNFESPYPCYTPTSALDDPVKLQQEIQQILGEYKSFKKGSLEMLVEDIVQEIWQRTASAKKQLAEWVNSRSLERNDTCLYGMELYNVIFDGELQLKEVDLKSYPSIVAWRALTRECFVFFAQDVGDLIQAVDGRNCPSCQTLSTIAKGVLHCRVPDLNNLRSRRSSTSWTTEICQYTLAEDVKWHITGDPFRPCDLPICYGATKVQRLIVGKETNNCLDNNQQVRSPIPYLGGVRFGCPLQVEQGTSSVNLNGQQTPMLRRQLERWRLEWRLRRDGPSLMDASPREAVYTAYIASAPDTRGPHAQITASSTNSQISAIQREPTVQ